MRLVTQQEISQVLTFENLIPALRQGFIDYTRGLAHSAPITNIDFPASHGEMHIKPGYLESTSDACVKVVTCFYDNPRQGLPTRDGCVVVASREDGRMKALLADAGLITDMRTAGSSAVAVDFLQRRQEIDLGLVGSGTQALWHARAIATVRTLRSVRVWGRDASKARELCERITAELGVAAEPANLAEALDCDVIVTATPAREPIIGNQALKAGAVIVAMGADAVGKRELGEEAVKRVAQFVADDAAQCRKYGELQWLPEECLALELGRLLTGQEHYQPDGSDVVVYDSTGLGFQDAVGARLVLEALGQ
ncbi:ornithine cyclodeaminase family protein [Alicycliphilus denitrificans]|uniref:Ornithine cyclodeaminase family protein n=1 Tax=Alicycliphilus denitrificans TaxID=179636 RepID=A0A3R7H382_9BURK|nr:ornithine cyclodeaminase family protein [Alicycliphilus denitrificans]RKJ98483.1 ornithine cyclodeaminase family protein [Alicycliphilus denitrificans]